MAFLETSSAYSRKDEGISTPLNKEILIYPYITTEILPRKPTLPKSMSISVFESKQLLLF
jgi:hypothetical protein